MKKLYDVLNESFTKKAVPVSECIHEEILEGIMDLEFDEDQANMDRLAKQAAENIANENQQIECDIPEDVQMMTIEELIEGMHGNVSEEAMDRQLKLFKKIANILGVKRYDDIIVAINDGQYDPKYLM